MDTEETGTGEAASWREPLEQLPEAVALLCQAAAAWRTELGVCVCVRDEMVQIRETDLLCGALTPQGGKLRAQEMG